MLESLVGKVRLNYDFYSGVDNYSDGPIEDLLLEIVKEHSYFDDVINSYESWPILYHLSSKRQNILSWYNFGEDSDVLEIGSGCGAITGLFAERSRSVTCIEFSKKRSLINAYRNSNKSNIEIIIGDFNDVKLDKKFDYITLIGVLEYSNLISQGKYNDVTFIEKIKSLLKPGGRLIIAIENKLGFKYWAGAAEDHTGRLFSGIEGYDTNDKVKTYSKAEIIKLIESSKLSVESFYYPSPDYKFCNQIFSDHRIPRVGEIYDSNVNYDRDKISFFNNSKVINNIISSGHYDVFANSFLIFARN